MKLLMIAGLCLFVTACGEPEPVEPPIPPPSATGANIMVYKVNGDLRVCNGTPSSLNAAGVSCSIGHMPTDTSVYISGVGGTQSNRGALAIQLYIGNITVNQNYPISGVIAPSERESYATYRIGTLYGNDAYKAHINSGQVIFSRFDNEVAAGRFSFVAFNPNEEKMEITEGYFDIKK